MKKTKYRRIYIILVILLCAVAYLIMHKPPKTMKAAYNDFEDKINFKGFYFIDEHVVYTGDTKEIGLKYKTGDLVSRGTSIGNGIVADEAGMIITNIDGFENKYNRKNIKDITPKEINNIVKNSKMNSGIKIVNNSQWYVCALLDGEDKKYFKKGMSKDVSINNKYYIADVIDIFRNNKSVIIVLRFKNDLDAKNMTRAISGYIVKSKYEGITISEKSIVDYNGSKGVFINLNGYAEFRKIKVLSTMDDKAIVIPDKDSKPKLMEYDEVICNPNGMKAGKKIR